MSLSYTYYYTTKEIDYHDNFNSNVDRLNINAYKGENGYEKSKQNSRSLTLPNCKKTSFEDELWSIN